MKMMEVNCRHIFMIFMMLLLPMYQNTIGKYSVGANLLRQLPKSTTTPEPKKPIVLSMSNGERYIKEFSSYSSSSSSTTVEQIESQFPSGSLYDDFSQRLESQIEQYVNFLKDFAKWKNWQSVFLYFPYPEVNQYICRYFQIFLIRSNDLHVICKSYNHAGILATNGTVPVTSTTRTTPRFQFTGSPSAVMRIDRVSCSVDEYRNSPIVILNFLAGNVGNTISPKLLYLLPKSTETLLLLGQNFTWLHEEKKEQQQEKPHYYFNYKVTIASYQRHSSQTQTQNVTGTNQTSETVRLHLKDVYGFATSPKPVHSHLGVWTLLGGFRTGCSPNRNGLNNFHGRTLRVTSVEGNPVVYLDRNPSTNKVIKARGYLPDILETLSQNLNFTYILIEPTDRSFGSVDATGNYSGMVGQLQRQEVDFAMMSFSFTAARKEVMDFSPPIEYSSARLLIRRDFEITELKWTVYLSPFEWKVWLAIPLTISLGVLILQCFSCFKIMDISPITSTCLLVICLLQKSVEGHAFFTNLPSRIALGSFWILSVVIYASYTAVLTSFLAASTEKLPLNSLAEAVANKNWKVGLTKGSSYQDRVKDSQQPELRLFWNRIEEDDSGLVPGFRDGIAKVYTEKYAFFTSDLVPAFMIKENCSYAWVPGSYFPGFGYMGYQKNLPFATPISQRVAKIRETGQLRRLFKKWWGESSSCSSVTDDFVGMSLYETGTAFIILILGMCLAISFLTGELFCRSREHSSDSEMPRIRSMTRSMISSASPEEINRSHSHFLYGNEYHQNSPENRQQEIVLKSKSTPEQSSIRNIFGKFGRKRETRLPEHVNTFWNSQSQILK